MREPPVAYTDIDSARLNDEGKRSENLFAMGRIREDVCDHFVLGLFGEHAFARRFNLIDSWWNSVSCMHDACIHDDGGYDFQASLGDATIKIDVKCHPVGSDWMLACSIGRKPRAHVYVCTLLDPANKQVLFAGWCSASMLVACPNGVASCRLGRRVSNLFPVETLFCRVTNVAVRTLPV